MNHVQNFLHYDMPATIMGGRGRGRGRGGGGGEVQDVYGHYYAQICNEFNLFSSDPKHMQQAVNLFIANYADISPQGLYLTTHVMKPFNLHLCLL